MASSLMNRRKNRLYDPVRVSVVGLSGQEKIEVGGGVGKSCLCSRFVRPQHDDYERSEGRHSSWISAADAASPQVLNGHFLYYGRASRTSDDGSVEVKVDVVEQTEFYDTDRSCRFMFGNRPYVERALLRSLEARGKTTYIDMDAVGTDAVSEYAVPFPQAFWKKGVQGFLCLYDPTLASDHPPIGERQNQLVRQLILQAQKQTKLPIVMAVTKCDTISSADFDQHPGIKEARHLAATAVKRLPLIFCSAKKNVNVDSAFLCLANMILRGKLDESLPEVEEYVEAVATKEKEVKKVEGKFSRLLIENVVNEEVTWRLVEPKIMSKGEYKRLVELCGREAALLAFKMRIIRLVWLASQSTVVEFSGESADVRREKGEKMKREKLSAHQDFKNDIDSFLNIKFDDIVYETVQTVEGADRPPAFSTQLRQCAERVDFNTNSDEDEDDNEAIDGWLKPSFHLKKQQRIPSENKYVESQEHDYAEVPESEQADVKRQEHDYAEVPQNEQAEVPERNTSQDDASNSSSPDYLPMDEYVSLI